MKYFPLRMSALLWLAIASPMARAEVVEDSFGKMPDGAEVRRWTISNPGGASVTVVSYGATITSLIVPDRNGKPADVVLGYDSLEPYLRKPSFFGAIVGRYGNRIGGARFTLNEVEHRLTANERGNILHGGRRGFDKVVWTGARIDDHTVEFSYLSKDGEEGFPGNLTARVRYSLSELGGLRIAYTATTDKDTVVNLTQHSFFNLAGEGNGDILNHQMMIDADQITPTDAQSIPTGAFMPVQDSPFDFRAFRAIGREIDADDAQIRIGRGYDINFVLTKQDGFRHAATVYDPASGRTMELWTTEPGVQLYTGNGLDGSIVGKSGGRYVKRGGLCLETQHFPDSPNQPGFPSTVLKAGETYRSATEYRFSAKTPPSTGAAASPAAAGIDLSTGWALIKEGQTEGVIEMDAHHASSTSPHVLRIQVTRGALEPGAGRVGAISAVPISVRDGQWFDVRFAAVTQQGSVGMVFSLEAGDGKVLARTTLPEIGRGRGRRGATVPASEPTVWPKYLVALHARSSNPVAHLVITPIEATHVWMENLSITPR